MAGFLYYFPGDAPLSRETLSAAGFALANLAEVPGRECTNGPDKGTGWVFALSSPSTPDGIQPLNVYRPEEQQWREGYDGKLWLGWQNADPPNRADLQRKVEVSGRPVTMADGKAWMVPILRDRMGNAGLPATLAPGPNRTVVQISVLPEFGELWALVEELWRAVSVDSARLTQAELFAVACRALAMNYRVGPWEIAQLGLFTTDTLASVFAAIVDAPEPDKDAS